MQIQSQGILFNSKPSESDLQHYKLIIPMNYDITMYLNWYK